jgi:NAD dependent epimerase/dehydratase family enzyme
MGAPAEFYRARGPGLGGRILPGRNAAHPQDCLAQRHRRLSLGGKQGNGRQFVSWIHESDYARAVEFLIAREDIDGPINLAAPNPLPNREFMAALREAWDVPNGLPAPWLAIQLGALFLRTEPELVLSSCRAIPCRLLRAGFKFEFPDWPEAAQNLVQQWKNRDY